MLISYAVTVQMIYIFLHVQKAGFLMMLLICVLIKQSLELAGLVYAIVSVPLLVFGRWQVLQVWHILSPAVSY